MSDVKLPSECETTSNVFMTVCITQQRIAALCTTDLGLLAHGYIEFIVQFNTQVTAGVLFCTLVQMVILFYSYKIMNLA